MRPAPVHDRPQDFYALNPSCFRLAQDSPLRRVLYWLSDVVKVNWPTVPAPEFSPWPILPSPAKGVTDLHRYGRGITLRSPFRFDRLNRNARASKSACHAVANPR